ncbi:MAG TPA: response regulator [Anaerolineaceae bacterium]|nr:response regulator [Anaerolineaceae bacterium]HPN52667.1 response regulator [Anaerolineaceae bacterium]
MVEQPVPTILVIDDEPGIRIGLKAALQREGFSVLAASDGGEGERMARIYRPDLIISDVMMPPPNGFELKRRLQDETETAVIPFIFLTARMAEEDRLRGFSTGADDYITKPFSRQELVARVKAILRRQELGRQVGQKEAEARLEQLHQEISKNITHELRTPMSSVLTSLDILLQKKFSRPEELAWFAETALKNAERMQGLVEDLIFLTDLDAGLTYNFRQNVNLNYDLRQTLERKLSWWKDRQLMTSITIASDVILNAPRGQLCQAAAHLLDNACKFSPEGGQVGFHVAANGDGGCIITVTDEGEGIPLDFREKVFERYYQISQGDARIYGGLGVGLTIARAFARGLGGDVTILGSQKGCRVQMVIPPGKSDWG